MLDFNEELKRFKPKMKPDAIEEVINEDDLKDVMDLLKMTVHVDKE